MPRNTPVKRKIISASINISLADRLDALSKSVHTNKSRLIDEAIMDLLAKYKYNGKDGSAMLEKEAQTPVETKHVICIANNKGGVGKTTTTAALAYLFAKQGHQRVLLIDADAQINLTLIMQAPLNDKQNIKNAILSDIAQSGLSVDHFITPTQYKGIDIIPGHEIVSSDAFMEKIKSARVEYGINPWQDIIEDAKKLQQYDIILIDTHPSNNAETTLPLQASDCVLVPTQPSNNSVAGLYQIYDCIRKSRRATPNLRYLGMFFNCVKQNTSSAKEFIPAAREDIPQEIAAMNGGKAEGTVFQTTIRDSEDVRKAENFQAAVTDKFRNKKIGKDFEKLYEEVLSVL